MDALLKSLSLGFILRSGFAGAFFILAYEIAALGSVAVLERQPKDLAAAAPISLVLGITVYSVHRALLYPLLEFALDARITRAIRARFPLISEATISSLLKVWAMAADRETVAREYAIRTASWGDYTHMLYASALSLAAGSITAVAVHPGVFTVYYPLVGLDVMLVIAAAVSDWRLNRVYDRIHQSTESAGVALDVPL